MNFPTLTYQSSNEKLPDGVYQCRFTRIDIAPEKDWQAKIIPEGFRWIFAVTSGAQVGKEIGKITGKIPTKMSNAGKIITSLIGREPSVGENVSALIESCVGKPYMAILKNGKIETIAIAISQ
ncbi:hypothetical protein BH11PLA2_BH11PLA2_29290 [soil metagenome]